jgi:hypothetical protein
LVQTHRTRFYNAAIFNIFSLTSRIAKICFSLSRDQIRLAENDLFRRASPPYKKKISSDDENDQDFYN